MAAAFGVALAVGTEVGGSGRIVASGAGAGAEVGVGTAGIEPTDGPDSAGDDVAGEEAAGDDRASDGTAGDDTAGEVSGEEAAAELGGEDAGCDDAAVVLEALGELLDVQAPTPNAATAASAMQAATRRRVINAA